MDQATAVAAETMKYYGGTDGNPQIVETVSVFFVAIICIAVLDFAVARFFKARYFVLHVAANAVIATFCVEDLILMITDPLKALSMDVTSNVPLGIVYAIHVYHMVAPGFRLYFVDWLHHILMVVLGCPAMMIAKAGPIGNFNFFFICGLPGGLDYLMLVLVKQRLIKPLTEKKYNRLLNLWCRTPFLIATSTFFFLKTHIDLADSTKTVTAAIFATRIFCILLNAWNGLYFMDRVVGNYYVVSHKLREEYLKAKKMPRSESNARLSKLALAAEEKDLKNPVMVDGVDEHPLPSAVPGMKRSWKFKPVTGLWSAIRSGS